MVHRIDGPAITGPGGRREWWINDRRLTEQDHRLLKIATLLDIK